MSTLPPDKFNVVKTETTIKITSWNLNKPATLQDVLDLIAKEAPNVAHSKIQIIEGYNFTEYICHL